MTTFPALPGWDGIHPAMVHFPIALFIVAPVLLLVSLFSRQAWKAWVGAALVLMFVGTFAAWLAVSSGHAAGQLVDKTQILAREIARHEALGVTTRNLFTVLTCALALLMLVPAMIRKRLPAGARITLHAMLLVACIVGTAVLANTASQGGRLVHTFGVRAMVEKPADQATQPRASMVTPPAPGDRPKAP